MENINKSDKEILKLAYFERLKTENQRPKSVFAFVTEIQMEEVDFYNYYASFDAIESELFLDLFSNSIVSSAVDEKEPKEKLTSVYHHFFNQLTANRSLVKIILREKENKIKALSSLAELRKKYKTFVQDLNLKFSDFGSGTVNEIMQKSVVEASWGQFVFTINYWLKDESIAFQKTHTFIDKSMATGFDLLEKSPLEGLVDLGKFLFSEPFKSN